MRHNSELYQRGGPRQASGLGPAARLPRVITSDKRVLCNCVLCQLSALISLGFFDTLHTPPKTPGNRPLQAG